MHELVSQNQFKGLDRPPNEEEIKEISGIPFSTLVEEAYDQLDKELDNGLTPQLLKVLEEQSRRLLVFWRIQQEKYDKALEEGLVQRFRPGEENENCWLIEGDIKFHNTYDNENQVVAIHLETPEEDDTIVLFEPLQIGPRLFCWPKRSKKGPRMPSYEVFYKGPLIMRLEKKERISDPAGEEEFYVGRKSKIDFAQKLRDQTGFFP